MCAFLDKLLKKPVSTTDQPISLTKAPILLFIVSAGPDPANHHANEGIDTLGWLKWVDQNIKPAIDRGYTRFQIHNPFGTIAGHQMETDQAISAKEAGLNFFLDSFVEAWAPITAKYEVIAYMGSPFCTPRFYTNYNDQTQGKEELLICKEAPTVMNIFKQSYELPFKAKMSIGFDALSMAKTETELGWTFMKMIQNLGVRTYIETCPVKDYPFQWNENFQFTQQVWENILAAPDVWNEPFKDLPGEKVRLLNANPIAHPEWTNANYYDWLPLWIKDCLSLGHTPSFFADKPLKDLMK